MRARVSRASRASRLTHQCERGLPCSRVHYHARVNPSPRSTLLLASHVDEAFREQLAARFDLLGPFAAPFPEAVLALAPEDVARVRAIYTIGVVPITRVVIDALPSLRIIACGSTPT